MHLSRYLKIYPHDKRQGLNLLYSTKTGATLHIDDDTLRAAREGTLAGSERDTLTRLGILVPDPDMEREEMRDIFITANKRRNLFQGIVVLNLDCNLSCPYCYEGSFRKGQYMSPATADLVVKTIRADQIEKGRDVVLTFYGGEPLLSISIMKEIAGRLKEAAALRGTGFAFNLVTNGTLLSRQVAEDLVSLGLNGAKFTLDGPRETHDRSRPFVSGKGSYDVIIARIKEVWDLVPIQIGGNYTSHNYRSFPLLLDHLIYEGITPEKVTKVFFTPVIARGGKSSINDFNSGCACDYEPWVMEAGLFLREEVLARGFSAPKLKLFSCMVELENDLIINFDGSLYKCPAFMAYDGLRVGTLESGIRNYRVSHNMDVWKNEDCLNCAYLPLCFGGCRQMTLLRNGEINAVDCRKDYFDTALEKIILQDLKHKIVRKI